MAKKPNGAAQLDMHPAADTPVEPLAMAVQTLTGDLRDFILDRLRLEKDARPWAERNEADQRDTVTRVEDAVRFAVGQAVQIIAAQGHQVMRATLAQITVKDGFKAVLEMSKHDQLRHQFVDAQGATVLVVMADMDEFIGERAPVKIIPDQANLPVETAMAVHSEVEGGAGQLH